MEGIIAAIITGVLSLIGVVVSNLAANAKMTKELEKAQAVTDTKIEELTREVREHNNFAKRVPVLEERRRSPTIESATLKIKTNDRRLFS